ncbi:MAG TPA: hypothetical protein VKH35_07090 [Thermoanaerobaculia bacterium]|jgi:hypothetical protein|nr:hypothetical protein [Thermoanaerobaculia bacterium]
MTNPVTIHGVTFTFKGLLFAAAVVQWLLVIVVAIVTPRAKRAWRRAETALVISTLVAGGAWYAILMYQPHPLVQQAAMTGAHPHTGSCGTIKSGMSQSEVQQQLGKPDRIRTERETRGPAAEAWIYDDMRCAIHLYGSKVDSIE